MEFVHPFPGKQPGDKITDQELLSAIRLSLCAEEEATHLYDTIAEFVSDERVKKVMTDVASEEQVHAGEFQKLLKVLEDDEEKLLEKGEDEAEEKMASANWIKKNCKFAATIPYENIGEYKLDRRKLVYLLQLVTYRQRRMIELRYGLAPETKGQGWTFDRIGKEFNLTRERTKAIIDRAVDKLKRIASYYFRLNPDFEERATKAIQNNEETYDDGTAQMFETHIRDGGEMGSKSATWVSSNCKFAIQEDAINACVSRLDSHVRKFMSSKGVVTAGVMDWFQPKKQGFNEYVKAVQDFMRTDKAFQSLQGAQKETVLLRHLRDSLGANPAVAQEVVNYLAKGILPTSPEFKQRARQQGTRGLSKEKQMMGEYGQEPQMIPPRMKPLKQRPQSQQPGFAPRLQPA